MAIDAAWLALSLAYYLADYFLLKFHVSALPVPYFLAYAIDTVIAGLVIYRMFMKDKTFIITAALVMPVFWFIRLALYKINELRYFSGIADSSLLLILSLAYAALLAEVYLFNPNSKQKIIKARGKPLKLEEKGEYPVFVNPEHYIPERARYSHTQVIGTTGSGKTRFVFYPWILQDIKNGTGVFICDIKSNMRERIEDFVVYAKRDMDYYCLDLGDIKSDTYNPLSGGSPDEISNRVFSALYNDSDKGEQFYVETAETFIRNAVKLLTKKFGTIIMKDLHKAALTPKVFIQPIINEYKNDSSAMELLKIIKDENYNKNISGLVNKLSRFVTTDWAGLFNARMPVIDIKRIISENKILLFQPQAGKYDRDYKAVSIMLMMHMQSEIANRYSGAARTPFFMYLDEFSNIVYPGFKELINKAREAKVGLIFGHQALGDLGHDKENIKNIILSNSNNKIILKTDDPETVDYFIKTIGTQTVETPVNSYSTKSGTVTPAGYTLRREEQYVIQPSDLRSLVLGEGIIKIDTLHGRLIEKIRFKDIPFQLGRGVKIYKAKRDPANYDTTDNFEVMEKEAAARAPKPEPGGAPEGFITVKDLRKRAKSDKAGEKEEGPANE